MLKLVFSYRYHVRLVQQNVGCHQHRISIEPGINIIRVFRRFVFELGHTVQFPDIGKTVQYPCQFGMPRYMGLVINTIFCRIESCGNI